MMDNQKTIFEFIKAISGQANVFTIPRLYIKLTGSMESALFLSQCVYWSDKGKRPDGSFYKSYAEWSDELGLSRRQIDAARYALRGIVSTELHRANGSPTLHWRVDMMALAEAITQFVHGDQSDLYKTYKTDLYIPDKSLTETTTETTTAVQPDSLTPCSDLETEFCNASKLPLSSGGIRSLEALRRMREAGVNTEDMRAAVDILAAKKYRITSAASVENTAVGIAVERLKQAEMNSNIVKGEGYIYV